MHSETKNSLSRRDLIKASGILSAGLTSLSASACQSGEKPTRNVLNPASARLLKTFQLKYPIFQAAPGGEALAIAIANAGGMGAITLGWTAPEAAAKSVSRMLDATNGNFYGNFVLHFGAGALQASLDAGCPCVQFSWGIPTRDMVKRVRRSGAKLGIQVSNLEGAELALTRQPDFLICQGIEAGGHVQATSSLAEGLSEIVNRAGDVPVIAAGGLSDGHDIRRVMNIGAAGAVMGTRFMATQESDAHAVYKSKLLEAEDHGTAYTNCFNQDWDAAHRVLRNETLSNWEAVGCPLKSNKPGEGEIVATHPLMGAVTRYAIMPPVRGHEGALDQMAMYAGTGVGRINDLPRAEDLIERLWFETTAT
ncbi:MAG: nitronate monooxygenase [Hyphomonas sp.]|nr:nitronate monooxygenase [Hyphomonas sp.]